jgi:hypothetical protein
VVHVDMNSNRTLALLRSHALPLPPLLPPAPPLRLPLPPLCAGTGDAPCAAAAALGATLTPGVDLTARGFAAAAPPPPPLSHQLPRFLSPPVFAMRLHAPALQWCVGLCARADHHGMLCAHDNLRHASGRL